MFLFQSQGRQLELLKGALWASTQMPSNGKESVCDAGDSGSIPGLERSPGEENGYPPHYSCLENSMDRGVWQATVHGIAESDMTECLTHRYTQRSSVPKSLPRTQNPSVLWLHHLLANMTIKWGGESLPLPFLSICTLFCQQRSI